jgi:hypothetical protein
METWIIKTILLFLLHSYTCLFLTLCGFKEKQLTSFYKFTKPRESIKQPNKHTILSKLTTI